MSPVIETTTEFPPAIAGSERISIPVWAAALDSPQVGLLILDAQLRLLHYTSQVCPLLGLPAGEPLTDLDALQLLSKAALDQASVTLASNQIAKPACDRASTPVFLQTQDQTKCIRMVVRNIGDEYRVASFESANRNETPPGPAIESSRLDTLTGLAGRNSFEEVVSEALVLHPEQQIAVVLVDLDRFKAVNDTLGHATGDALLRLAGERLKAAVRKHDLVARLAGNEYAVMVRCSPNPEEAVGIAKRILDLVQRTYLIEGQLVNVGVSVGIAQAPADGAVYHDLMRNANLALHFSKATGRSSFHFFEPHMERRAQARRTSELELRRALALRQLEVFYQPQVNTETGNLVGFEALLRWRHPERGMIPPNDFLPIAEETGMIVAIGDWVLRTACREAKKWPDDLVVAVNVSPLQFDAGNFEESVRRALNMAGLPGERLEVEITEGILLRSDDGVLKTLHELRAMNVRIAMDDFGTGYASLSQLARFPFDKIKIDRSLASCQANDLKQRAIVRAITSLGKSLGVCTIAEGIENADQVGRLQEDGCFAVQGFFYGRPTPSDQLSEVISKLHSIPKKP